jgi:hypothetical protein
MKKSTIYIIVAVVIIIIVIGAVVAYEYTKAPSTTSPTPTPTASPVPVGNATTLSFSANVTSGGTTITYNWKGINIHTAPIVRVDFAGYAYIMNTTAEKSWGSTDSGKTWTASNFTADWPSWGAQWSENVNALTHWDGTSATYSFTGVAQAGSVVLFNIVVNPTIPDSTFQTS